jgi:hypothetical protein
MCLNETYSKVRIGKHLYDRFPVQNGLKQGDALSPLLLYFALEYAISRIVCMETISLAYLVCLHHSDAHLYFMNLAVMFIFCY